ncbi:restriction endonuclease subunit M [Caproiciproducens sp.]
MIKLNGYPVEPVLKILLEDKTTKQNIIFATDTYTEDNPQCTAESAMTAGLLLGFQACPIQPRVAKAMEDQQERTRKKAEVFTPSWVCALMNNHCDDEWFGRPNVFTTLNEQEWQVSEGKILFNGGKGRTWKDYVDSRRIEITCGEAPYIVSRYDTTSGESIEIKNRIGILDRKLRVVGENVADEAEWMKWVIRAYQSVYGYEFQGDNLLIARINLLETFVDYTEDRWNRKPTVLELRKIANIISWNFWQMDGISDTIPYGVSKQENEQLSLFDFIVDDTKEEMNETPACRVFDWRKDRSIPYTDVKRGNEE